METPLINTGVLLDCRPAAYVSGRERTEYLQYPLGRPTAQFGDEIRRFGNIMCLLNQGVIRYVSTGFYAMCFVETLPCRAHLRRCSARL
jgi:hypothetical protein